MPKVKQKNPNRPAQEESSSHSRPASKADAFDEVAPGGAFFPVGKWVAMIIEAEYQTNDKGESVMFKYEGLDNDNDEVDGKTLSQWYSIFDAKGQVGKGVGFLKKDLETLGFDEEQRKFEHLEATLEELVNAKIVCNITVKQNGTFTNAYLQSVVDQDEE